MRIKLIELSGLKSTLIALRNPFKGQIKTNLDSLNITSPEVHKDDYKLLKILVKSGDEHAKCIRSFRVTLDVTAPRYFWSEHDTYRIGVDCLSSESTMHTLLKEDINQIKFDKNTSKGIIAAFKLEVLLIQEMLEEGSISKINALVDLKRNLPESFLQTRTIQYNYQALRRIYKQRHNHRLQCWKDFCKYLETLPMSELITNKE